MSPTIKIRYFIEICFSIRVWMVVTVKQNSEWWGPVIGVDYLDAHPSIDSIDVLGELYAVMDSRREVVHAL